MPDASGHIAEGTGQVKRGVSERRRSRPRRTRAAATSLPGGQYPGARGHAQPIDATPPTRPGHGRILLLDTMGVRSGPEDRPGDQGPHVPVQAPGLERGEHSFALRPPQRGTTTGSNRRGVWHDLSVPWMVLGHSMSNLGSKTDPDAAHSRIMRALPTRERRKHPPQRPGAVCRFKLDRLQAGECRARVALAGPDGERFEAEARGLGSQACVRACSAAWAAQRSSPACDASPRASASKRSPSGPASATRARHSPVCRRSSLNPTNRTRPLRRGSFRRSLVGSARTGDAGMAASGSVLDPKLDIEWPQDHPRHA